MRNEKLEIRKNLSEQNMNIEIANDANCLLKVMFIEKFSSIPMRS